MKLFLVRHGQDEDNTQAIINGRRDTSLSQTGRQQALAAARLLRSANLQWACSSPMARAKQTARIILEHLGLAEAEIENDLIERDYGILTGKPASEIPNYASRIVPFGDFKYVVAAPGIEDYTETWRRAGSVLRRIQARHGESSGLIVAHNDILKMLRANFEGIEWEEELKRPPLQNGQVIVLG